MAAYTEELVVSFDVQTSTLTSGLNAAQKIIDQFNNIIDIAFDIDYSELYKVDQFIKDLNQDINIYADTDYSQVSELNNLVQQMDTDIDVNTNVDSSEVKNLVDEINQVDPTLDIIAEVNDQSIKSLQDEIKSIDTTVDILTDVNDKELNQLEDDIQSISNNIDILVDVDQQELIKTDTLADGLDGRSVDMRINIDGVDALEGLEDFDSTALNAAGVAMGVVATGSAAGAVGMTTMAGSAVAAGVAVDNLDSEFDELTASIKDSVETTHTLGRVLEELDKEASGASEAFSSLNKELENEKQALKDQSKETEEAAKQFNFLTDAVDQAKKSMVGFGSGAKQVMKDMDITSYLPGWKSFAVAIAAVGAAVWGIVEAFKPFVETAAQFEQFETTLATITGSAQEAERSMDWISDFAKTTPYELDQVTESFVKLKAYGLDPMDGTLETLGDTAAGMGKPIMQAVEAMADAIVGENERLKEFGIKASKTGDTIAYSWIDSSGKAREAVIKNNQEIIQSTLNAIFNEKYAGAMIAQSKTWNGMISNISDSWTIFKKDVMDEGLFDYFKGIAMVVSEGMNTAFSDAKNSAAGWSTYIIEGIKTTILAFGNLYDVVTGIQWVIKSAEVAFLGFGVAVGQMTTGLANGFAEMNAQLTNSWNSTMHSLEVAWVEVVNYMGRKWTEFSNWFAAGWNDLAPESLQISVDAFIPKGVSAALAEVTANTYELNDATKEMQVTLTEAQGEWDELLKSMADEEGFTIAEESIRRIDEAITKMNEAEGPDKGRYKQELADILEKYGIESEAIDKISKAKTKAADKVSKETKKAKKDAKDLIKTLKDQANDFMAGMADASLGVFDGFMNNDFKGMFDGLSSAFMYALTEMEIGYQSFSAYLDTITMSSIWGFALKAASIAMASMNFDDIAEPPSLGENFSSESIENALEDLNDTQYKHLDYTKSMTEYLSIISKSFGGIENSLIRFGEVGGQGLDTVVDDNRTYEYYGSSIDVGEIDLSNFGQDITAELDTVIERTKEGLLGVTVSYQHYLSDISGSISGYMQSIAEYTYRSFQEVGERLSLETGMLDTITIDLPKIDVSDMSAAEAAQALEAAWGAQMDQIATNLFGEALYQYQLAGEGLYETAIRVATDLDQVSYALEQFDITLIETIDPLTGVTTKTYELAQAMIEGAGGIEELISGMEDYTTYFFSQSEQVQMATAQMADQFAALGLAMPSSNAEFRKLVESIDTTTTSGAALYGTLMGISGAFNEVTAASAALKAEQKQEADDAADAARAEARRRAQAAQRALDSRRRAQAAADKEELRLHEELADKLKKLYTGSLSYLNQLEQGAWLENYANKLKQEGSTDKYLDALEDQLKTYKATSVTKEDYVLKAEKYATELMKADPKKTLDDLWIQTETTNELLNTINSSTIRSSYQQAI